MKSNYRRFVTFAAIAAIMISSCGFLEVFQGGKTVTVSIVYGSEKRAWFEPLITQFNIAGHEISTGEQIVISAEPMGSVESAERILAEEITPTVWSPASSAYIPVAEARWRQGHPDELVYGKPQDLVLSPVVIAMWEPMAKVLGWPDRAIGWSDIAELATSEEGWDAYGYPEWGDFKLGHTHPGFSNSGVISIIAEVYAGAEKQRDLTVEDVESQQVFDFMSAVESSIIHYGRSTGFFADKMFTRGPSYLSAAVLYENLIVEQETARLQGQSSQQPVVAIYPKEGTFWSNHPYVILNTPWVTDQEKEAAEMFLDFLLAEPQQEQAIEYGFRPADPSISLSSPLDKQHGVDTDQPQTVLPVPSADVIEEILVLWQKAKKPVDLTVVMDISGSMRGDKIAAARTSLTEFVGLLDENDQLEIILFSDEIITLSELSPVGPKRSDVQIRISGIVEHGETRLFDATMAAYNRLEDNGDPDHIRAIVVLTDGVDTQSSHSLQTVLNELSAGSQEGGGNAIKVFTIAFGSDADEVTLQQLSEISGGKQYQGDPATIRDIYSDIATFF
jgi:Ca-activated chloride channel family protein